MQPEGWGRKITKIKLALAAGSVQGQLDNRLRFWLKTEDWETAHSSTLAQYLWDFWVWSLVPTITKQSEHNNNQNKKERYESPQTCSLGTSQVLLLNPELCIFARLDSPWASGTCLPVPIPSWVTDMSPVLTSVQVLGIWTQVLMLLWQTLYPMSSLPYPTSYTSLFKVISSLSDLFVKLHWGVVCGSM